MSEHNGQIERRPTGVRGLDALTHGGLPARRMTLVAGSTGSGKTILAGQFLAGGIDVGESGVLVTFEERPDAIRANLGSFGWDVPGWEASGRWAFVDASPRKNVDVSYTGTYDLEPLLARVRDAVDRVGAKRVAIDSVGSLMAQFGEATPVRHALFRMSVALEEMGVTSVMTAERTDEYGPVATLGFEEFVADNVIILRNALEAEKRRRTIEVLKLRGGSHVKGERLFTIVSKTGLVVVPLSVDATTDGVSSQRTTTGNDGLDEMCRGGLYENSLVVVFGPTGTGKSFVGTQLIVGGADIGERALLVAFEGTRDQLLRNAASRGHDLEAAERAGLLHIVAEAPESANLEDHLQRVTTTIEDFRPDRVVIDSLTALERIATVRSFREYVLGLAFQIRRNGALGVVTATTANGNGHSAANLYVSTVADVILQLHYLPVGQEFERGINVLKMRGSDHDKTVRRFTMDADGMKIGAPFASVERLV